MKAIACIQIGYAGEETPPQKWGEGRYQSYKFIRIWNASHFVI